MKPPAQRHQDPRIRRLRSRHRRLIAIAVMVAVLVLGSAGTALAYSNVETRASQLQASLVLHLDSGQRELEAAKGSLVQANAKRDLTLVAQARMHFTAAKVQFVTAGHVADSSKFLRDLEGLPVVGGSARSRHVAVDAVAAMGSDLSDAGLELASLAGTLISPPESGAQSGKSLLTVLRDSQISLAKIKLKLASARTAARAVDIRELSTSQSATLQRAQVAINVALTDINTFEALVPILNEILGGNGPRTYLVEQVNPAELRAGGGFIGTYSLLRVADGAITLVASGTATDFIYPRVSSGQPGYVAPPGAIKELIGSTSWSFIDSNFFPDFPTNATTAISFVQPRLGDHIDGVFSIDYYAVARMLDITGPLPVPGFSFTLNASNFIPLIIQYDIAAYTDVSAGLAHKAILAAAAGPLMQRLSALPSAEWSVFVGALNDLASAHHLQAYFNNQSVQMQMDQFGWTGAMHLSRAKDFVMEVESNLGGTKANYFLTRKFTMVLTKSGSTLHHQVTVDILDNMPYTYRPNEYYRAYIRLYVPDKATGATDDLVAPKYPNPSPPPGLRALDGWILIHGYGHDRLVSFQYDTVWQGDGRGQEVMYWQKQPGTLADSIEVTWIDGNGHTYKTSGSLDQDRLILLSPGGVWLGKGVVGDAQIPSLSLG